MQHVDAGVVFSQLVCKLSGAIGAIVVDEDRFPGNAGQRRVHCRNDIRRADAGANNVYDVQVTASTVASGTAVQNLAVTVTAVNDDFTDANETLTVAEDSGTTQNIAVLTNDSFGGDGASFALGVAGSVYRVPALIRPSYGRSPESLLLFAKLSLGQQQAILLTVLLFSKSRVPLIIDQPEDNLDGEFIYKTVVRSLRSIKEHRQVIIVTHNPNIAVLGDAELIIPLRGASEVSVIRDRGSIDTTETKDIVCTILEGSQKAFKRRQEVYGY